MLSLVALLLWGKTTGPHWTDISDLFLSSTWSCVPWVNKSRKEIQLLELAVHVTVPGGFDAQRRNRQSHAGRATRELAECGWGLYTCQRSIWPVHTPMCPPSFSSLRQTFSQLQTFPSGYLVYCNASKSAISLKAPIWSL